MTTTKATSATHGFRETGDAGVWELVITEAATITRDGHRPSDYERHTVTPGVYPIELVNIDNTEWTPEGNTRGYTENIGPYYGKVTVPTLRTERYSVDRLFAATKATHDTEEVEDTVTATLYGFQVREGETLFNGTIRRVG